jgi:O-acetyl-ADP-ribose deacetylase (regulator of RNase III)
LARFFCGNHRENEVLASCHYESIRVADERGLASLAFPAISTGAYGYPVHEAASVALSATAEALANAKHVTRCRFVLFDVSTVRAFERAAQKLSTTNSSFLISNDPESFDSEKASS